jgi:hypothetical protein
MRNGRASCHGSTIAGAEGIAHHLRTERCLWAQPVIPSVVQSNAIPAPVLGNHRDKQIAGIGAGCLHVNKRRKRRGISLDQDRRRALRVRHERLFGPFGVGFLHLGTGWSGQTERPPCICANQTNRREGSVAQARSRLLPTHKCGGIRHEKIR